MKFLEIENKSMPTEFSMSKPHSHEYFEIYFLLEGEREILFQERSLVIPEKTVCVFPPFSLHKTVGGPYHRININISLDYLSKDDLTFLQGLGEKCAFRIPDAAFPFLHSLLTLAKQTQEQDPKNDNEYKLHIVKTIICFLQSQALTAITPLSKSEQKMTADPIIKKLVAYLNENYQEELDLQRLCEEFFLSKATLCARFKKMMNCSIMDYLSKIRINKAMSLLTYTSKSIEEISCLCGFSSANYFGLVFKKFIGISPLNYRKTR